jgi:hypothetical protein
MGVDPTGSCKGLFENVDMYFRESCLLSTSDIPNNYVWGRGFQQIQLRTDGRENGDLGVVGP